MNVQKTFKTAAVSFLLFCCWLSAATLPSAARTPDIQRSMDALAKLSDLRENLVYKKAGDIDLTLDLVLPTTTKDKDGKDLFPDGAPVVLYFHGGGWIQGNRYTSFNALKYFSENGIALALVSYRFADGKNTVETCVTDCFDAARYLAKNAREYGLDPTRMLAYGTSAGGHLTLMAVLADPSAFPGDPSLADAQFRFVGGVAICPVSTLVDKEAWGERDYLSADKRFETLFGGSFEQTQAMAKKVSPLYWLKKDSPRLLIMHGDADKTVSIKGSLMMEAKAKELGADLTLLRVPNAGHNFKSERNPLWRVQRLVFLDNLLDMAQTSCGPSRWIQLGWR